MIHNSRSASGAIPPVVSATNGINSACCSAAGWSYFLCFTCCILLAAPSFLKSLLTALEARGWSTSDVQIVFLAPSDAKVAYTQGSVDAWSTWEPYTSQEEVLFQSQPVITAEGLTPGLGFQVASLDAIRDKRSQLTDFLQRLTAARAWSLNHVGAYAETWGKLMNLPPAVPLNWLSRAKMRVTPVDDEVVTGEQKTIDLYLRAGLIKQKLDAAELVDRSFSQAIGKGAGL